jgi:predicted DNA-binding transcriptional regulator YafY
MEEIMRTHGRCERLIAIIRFFLQHRSQQFSTMQIAKKFAVSEDTALRDMQFLSASGFMTVEKIGWYWSIADFSQIGAVLEQK